MRRQAFGLGCLALLLVACGGSGSSSPAGTPPSSSADDSLKFGADFDVNGRQMHIVCDGPSDTKEPTILLEAGGGLDSSSWADVIRMMQSTHRLCAYDRLGLGQSEQPVEASRTTADQVADLHGLLDAADVSGPFVIGAHSYGAMVATVFTQTYPDEVVGLLFVDPQTPHITARWRRALPAPTADEPSSITDFRQAIGSFETDPSQNPEHLHLRPSLANAAEAVDAPGPFFRDRPVVVLNAGQRPNSRLGLPSKLGKTIDNLWVAAQKEFVRESTEGSFKTVPGAEHTIQVDKPQPVIRALEEIVRDARAA